MDISVAICTRNRAERLRTVLKSLEPALSRANGDIEILVVENDCSDHTAEVITDAARRLPIRHLLEPTAGQSNARNAAIRAARGRYVVWTDDDTKVDAEWLRAYQDAISEYPDAAFFGGPVRPRLLGKPPRWLSRSLNEISAVFAGIDLGPVAFEIQLPGSLPFGANFAVRNADQAAIGYDPKLGRQPMAKWLAGDEYVLLRRLLELGKTGRWLPQAQVDHLIAADRQSMSYVLAHGMWNGRGFQRRQPAGCDPPSFLGSPGWLWRAFLGASANAARSWLLSGPDVWVPKVYQASVLAGRLREAQQGINRAGHDPENLRGSNRPGTGARNWGE